MHRTRVVLTSLVLFAISGCAYQSDLESVRRDTDEMKSRIFTIDKGLSEVRGEVKEGVDKSLAGYRQTLEALQRDMTGYQKDMAAIRKGGADLQATLDSARVDMQLLTGKVDDVRIMAQKPADDVELLKQDLNKRLASLDERFARLEKALDEQQKKATQLQQTPDFLYQQAYETMKGGDVARARELFAKFLELHPKHSLAANAHYWLGETYYSEKNFEQAILEFQEVIKNFPEAGKVPAAMLKQGMAFTELGDAKSAAYIYKKLADEFPKSEEAKVAREKMRAK
ncbi:MAG: tol-pal system protein YbgF [Geobacteraceae bacterium GWC2_58_44]|nr:MAG: tol-pal system protein YbgF [Geobacteraceae bacterium GWC2_58_44]